MDRTTSNRRGAILLIVLVLLALFAVVGLAFVLYSQAEATNSRIHKEIMNNATTERIDATPAVNEFMKQLIYPVADGPNVTSALRGHHLATLIYGYNPRLPLGNTVPYSGIGGFNQPIGPAGDRRSVINYSALATGHFVYEPEYTHVGNRTGIDVYNGTASNGVYVGKNAPYSYPDRNNAFMAMQDPLSGLVIMPSFHRPALFIEGTGITDPLKSLDSSNSNWTSAAGRYKILRPRPADHVFNSQDGRGAVSDFPYPPANPDGTITGDVQNIRYTNGTQRNDAIWMHANLPPVLYRGRYVQPLVAVTILPLDGRINLNVAGNRADSNTNPMSHNGFGAYEQNPVGLLVQTGSTVPNIDPNVENGNLINYRFANQPRPVNAASANLVNAARFDPTIPDGAYADYSPVNWNSAAGTAFNFATGGFRTDPSYPTAGWENNKNEFQHYSLYNPYFSTEASTVSGRNLRLPDLRQTAYRYSAAKSKYAPPLFGLTATDSSVTGASPNHPSNAVRAKVTNVSNSLSRPGLSPNFGMATPSTLTNDPFGAPFLALSGMPTFQLTAPTGGSDTVPLANAGYRSAAAALGPVDLNRPLADYRVVVTKPLADPVNSAAMAGQAMTANRDRQQFAKDIFDRLVLATGAPNDGLDPMTYRPVGYTTAAGNPEQAKTLRYLAQLAANIVDYVDLDDVSTAFVWNPAGPGSGDPMNPQYQQNFQAGTLGNRVVFGVEKSRLVLNEAYSEITNHPDDSSSPSANQSFHVRFFVEVLNPLNANRTGMVPDPNSTSPLGTGAADLSLNGNSVYRVLVFDNKNEEIRPKLFAPGQAEANVTGEATGQSPRITMTFPSGTQAVEPNNGQPDTAGFRELAPMESINDTSSGIYKPMPGPKVIQANGADGAALYYSEAKRRQNEIPNLLNQLNNPGDTGKHSILLQRLANPYLPTGPSNPYITVDTLWDIVVNDAIRVADQIPGLPPIPGTRPPNEPAPLESRRSHARRAPMYGYRGATAQASFAADQPMTGDVSMRLRGHNTAVPSGLLQPFEWLQHLDRKLISVPEILNVAGCKPHEVLYYFATHQIAATLPPGGLQETNKQRHLAPWFQPNTNLYRGLEMLTIKPWMYGAPVGGRVPGRVNINTVWDQSVLNAVLDPRAANTFTQTETTTVWNTLIAGGAPSARTKNLQSPTTTVAEGNVNGDRPIQSFGVSTFGPGGGMPVPTSVDDSLFRADTTTKKPFVYNTALPHPYPQQEILRKAYNNLTTVSDTYMVVFTIGYFEIRATGGGQRLQNMPFLGHEVYNEIPGDLRAQYGSTIDRTMLGLSPIPPAAGTAPQQAPNIFISELASNFDATTNGTQPITLQFRATGGNAGKAEIQYEGKIVKVRPSLTSGTMASDEVSTLVIGTGSEAVYVTIPSTVAVIPPSGGNGLAQITFPPNTFQPQVPGTGAAAPLRKYFTGESVSSAILGNPGPQGGFDPNSATYKQVIRDLVPLKP